MENIKEILKKHGIELTEEQEKKVNDDVNANYRTINDYNKQKDKLDLANQNLSTTKQAFEDFKKDYEGVDVKELKSKVSTLTQQLTDKDNEYSNKLNTIELKSKIKDALQKKQCIDVDVAMSQIKIDDLLKSQNQDTDLTSAVDSLAENKKFLFEKQKTGTKINVGGSTGEGDNNNVTTLKGALLEAFNK